MSKHREIWWSYAKAMIQQYPSLANVQQNLSVTKKKECEAVRKAIAITKRKSNGDNKLAVIDFVIWQNKGTLAMAAVKLYISRRTAERYHQEFVYLVGECYGLTK